ncbi:MAG: hypothetical protein GF416_04490 [Candidatus Altiarchaeales archaeon]|nr:hypothetical protein [Candidatus Altiarchaeales archaeon]MBD3416378.1 hypothetical protein [Candidatus Altiarchaeales archaeon]
MLYGISTAVKALKSSFIVLAAAAIMLGVLWVAYPNLRPESLDLRVNEVLTDPGSLGWDDGFIELHNTGDSKLSLEGWSVRTESGSINLFGHIEPGGYRAVYGGLFSGDVETVSLVDPRGRVADRYSRVGGLEAVSVGRSPDGMGSWTGFVNPTPGAPNTVVEKTPTTLDTLPKVEVPDCMEEEYEAVRADTAEEGFGSVDFCRAFEEEMSDLNPYVLRRINEISDEEIREAIALGVAERAVAREREERIVGLVVSDAELMDSIRGLIGDDLYSLGLDGELAKMNGRFKRMLFDIILNGTGGERREMRLQLKYYLESRESGGRKTLKFRPDEVRVMLSDGRSLQEILVELEV